MTVQGHTDNVGSSADNQRLSLQRAQKVVDYLADKEGIARNRMTAVGYGQSSPIADNNTEEGRRKNRRIHTVIECVSDIAGLTPLEARVTMALEMRFDIDQSTVRAEHRNDLQRVAEYLKENPRMTATVEGHASQTRSTATDEQAMRLSQQRAQNVVDYLVNQFDVPRNRLKAEGFGQTRRIAYGPTAESHRENRRVNIILNYPK
jgi:OOP family OmpA-OmpF porin